MTRFPLSVLSALVVARVASAQVPVPSPSPSPLYPAYPSETPATLTRSTDGFDHVRREVMIPMRDGVKLHTVDPGAEGREGRAHPADAHALQRDRAHQPRAERPPRPASSTATTTRST